MLLKCSVRQFIWQIESTQRNQYSFLSIHSCIYTCSMLVTSFGFSKNPPIWSAPTLLYSLTWARQDKPDLLDIFFSPKCWRWFTIISHVWLLFSSRSYSYLSSCWWKPEPNFTCPLDWLAFTVFPYYHKSFSFPLYVLTTMIREADGTCCAYLYEAL